MVPVQNLVARNRAVQDRNHLHQIDADDRGRHRENAIHIKITDLEKGSGHVLDLDPINLDVLARLPDIVHLTIHQIDHDPNREIVDQVQERRIVVDQEDLGAEVHVVVDLGRTVAAGVRGHIDIDALPQARGQVVCIYYCFFIYFNSIISLL